MPELMNDKENEELLLKVKRGVLGTVDDKGSPYVIPIGYHYVNRAIYLFFDNGDGQKVKNMRRNPNVCIQVTLLEPLRTVLRSGGKGKWKSVIVTGKAEIITDDTEKASIWSEATVARLRKLRPKGVYYKILPSQITGRKRT